MNVTASLKCGHFQLSANIAALPEYGKTIALSPCEVQQKRREAVHIALGQCVEWLPPSWNSSEIRQAYLNARLTMRRKPMLLAVITVAGVMAIGLSGFFTVGAAAKGDAKAGIVVYKKTCLRCHGEQCKGDGPGAKLLKTKPADWTDKAAMSKLTEDDLIKAVSKGGVAVGKSTAMPAFADSLKPQEIRDVVAYVLQVEGK
jgi:mono/diheme cytochrome c family protein